MKEPIRLINAEHVRPQDKSQPRDCYQDCPAVLKLAIGAKVRLNVNLWVKAGLYNGAAATVFDIIDDPDNEDPHGLPACVLIQMNEKYKGINSIFGKNVPRIIPIFPKLICHKNSRKSFTRARTQIPLSLDWARTIHKAQGMTLQKAFIDINHNSKYIFTFLFFFIQSHTNLYNIMYVFFFQMDQEIQM